MSASEIILSNVTSAGVTEAQSFDLYPLRFRYAALKLRNLSPNTLRGAFGSTLKNIDADAYARYFSPSGSGPSGFADPPRPFVFRILGPLDIGLNLFATSAPVVDLFTRAMAELGTLEPIEPPALIRLPLTPPARAVSRIRVKFLTPTEIKGGDRPEFGVLLARIRDRISTLRALYGSGLLEMDFRAFGERATQVSMTRCELTHIHADRLSRSTGQRHSLGGFVGVAEYAGDLAEFLPYLEITRWTGVGRQTVWGKGEISLKKFERDLVRGWLHEPAVSVGRGLVITHGAGSNCESPLLRAIAETFAAAGFHVLRCDLAFRQQRPHGPPFPALAVRDRESLERAAAAMREITPACVILGGHSYGGRQASILVSESPVIADLLLLLSYPLHPPRKPEQLRTAHFAQLRTPALFVHGSRDPFGTIEEMRTALAAISARHKLVEFEKKGHELGVEIAPAILEETVCFGNA